MIRRGLIQGFTLRAKQQLELSACSVKERFTEYCEFALKNGALQKIAKSIMKCILLLHPEEI